MSVLNHTQCPLGKLILAYALRNNTTVIPVKTGIHLALAVLLVSSGFPFSRE
jgi:hypothetical protein